MKKFCVIIPAYNAGEHLGNLLSRIGEFAEKKDIIVVDDGSQDDTSSIARDFGVQLLVHQRNLGKGAALKTAFRKAVKDDYDVAITIDADFQHPPELIPELLKKIDGGADMVVGNRRWDTSKMPVERRVSNFLSTMATSLLAGQHIEDSQCGFRAIRRWLLKSVRLKFNKYQHESEMLIEAARLGARISFINIPVIYNGNKSYFHPIKDTARFLAFLFLYYPTRLRK